MASASPASSLFAHTSRELSNPGPASSAASSSSSSSSSSSFSTSWPGCSSHLRRWVFRPEALQALRAEAHEAACRSLLRLRRRRKGESEGATSEDASASVPGLKALLDLTEYFALQLVLICKRKRIKLPVIETACVYLHRFWCTRSPLCYDIRLVIFACLLLALKAEDVARHYSLGDLLGDIAELDIGEVLRLELPVCDALDFHILVLHTRGPLATLMQQIFFLSLAQPEGASKRTGVAAVSPLQTSECRAGETCECSEKDEAETERDDPSRRVSAESEADDDAKWRLAWPSALRKLHEQSEAEISLMFVSSTLPLVHPPAILAIAAVLSAARNPSCAEALAAGGFSSVEKLVRRAVCTDLQVRTLKRKAEQDDASATLKRAKKEEPEGIIKAEFSADDAPDGARDVETNASPMPSASMASPGHSGAKRAEQSVATQDEGTGSRREGKAGGESAAEEGDGQVEAIWRACLEAPIAHIHEELGRIRDLQHRVHQQQVGESMGQILEACIDAIEEMQQADGEAETGRASGSARYGRGGSGSEDKKEKRKKKEKKKKRRREQAENPPDDGKRGEDRLPSQDASAVASQIDSDFALCLLQVGGANADGQGETRGLPSAAAAELREEPSDEQLVTSSDVSGNSSVVTSRP
ncbi:putative cyclin H [Neospora caninum Liverpool]|uniref:Cyclin H, putative n=1 Tax=Neospora caninum (strain Liverpool) TaxID=572307 RepID=F0VGP3_NEOCL|nr:putative cyclin H [Neospora caninum Liverpool]CBZ52887.1 putative cyclin H [Neospora caninum Liverpool]CEL66869.1 TPA: cyclin H, putative [Neospora caninum Liverpool]|eukprot:XP_003882919.1 putative cyclin H [Neospora caninum Liverpool]